ncbi:MAG: hypothetical protein DME40_18230, partial [Verrucomicrobia bacterium]
MKHATRWLLILISSGLATAPCLASAPWVTLQGGHYLIKRPNDGDSFHVSVEGHEYIFRLYFVDAPETSAEFRDRVEEQATYFGVTVDQVLQVGELAKEFTREKLADSFLVRTCWEDAGGRSRLQRFYAFVQTRTGDLGEQLVENGLARAHPATAKPEGLTSAAVEWKNLIKLEHKAKREKIGGWGANEERMTVRAQQPESERGIDPFDKFFHPAGEMPVQAAPKPAVTPGATPSASEETTPSGFPAQTKLDVNSASLTELEDVPGIGPSIAERIIEARPFKTADDLQRVK